MYKTGTVILNDQKHMVQLVTAVLPDGTYSCLMAPLWPGCETLVRNRSEEAPMNMTMDGVAQEDALAAWGTELGK